MGNAETQGKRKDEEETQRRQGKRKDAEEMQRRQGKARSRLTLNNQNHLQCVSGFLLALIFAINYSSAL